MLAKLKQLQFERDAWKRSLGFMMEENIHLKNRLSEILKGKVDKDLLDEVENFQSDFLMEDELINLLRHDVAELEKMFAHTEIGNHERIEEIDSTLKQLRKNIITAETQFGELKVEFNSYLSQIYSLNDMR